MKTQSLYLKKIVYGRFKKRLSGGDQLTFSQQMADLLNSGLPLLQSLQLIFNSAPPHWLPCLNDILDKLKRGEKLSDCLRESELKLNPIFTSLIELGEQTGQLNIMFADIANQLEMKMALDRKIRQALSYPSITLFTSLSLMLLMMTWVVPNFQEIFINFNAELPLSTLMLIHFSQFLMNHFILLILLSFITIFLIFFIWKKSISVQRQLDQYIIRFPLLGELIRLALLTRYCRHLAYLQKAGLPLLDAIRIIARSSNHWLVHDLNANFFKYLSAGFNIGKALHYADPKDQFFDRETKQLLQISAECGSLVEALTKRSIILEKRLYIRLDLLTQNLEPLLIVGVGCMIGALLITLYLPIFSLGKII